MPTLKPLISVIMPAYNAAPFIERAVASLQAQTLPNWELIVVNDGSKDATLQIIQNLAKRDSRIRPYSLAKNSGACVAANKAIEEARGTWLAILDADDAMVPERLEKMVNFATEHQLDMVGDNQLLFDFVAQQIVRQGFVTALPFVDWNLVTMCHYDRPGGAFYLGWMKPLIKTEFLKKHSIFYRPEYRYGQDFMLYAELLAHGIKAKIMRDPMYIYTLPQGELSGAAGLSTSPVQLHLILDAMTVFLREYPHLSPAEQHAIQQRYQRVADNKILKEAVQLIHQRQFLPALKLLITRADIWLRPTVWTRAQVAIQRKLKIPRQPMVIV